MSAPEVAVVIPTRAPETRLAFALEGLAEQTLAPSRFEVVVVRDGVDPSLPAPVVPEGLDVRVVDLPDRRGPGGARNAGWRAARAPLIAFTDSDCRPSPGWLEALLAAARAPDLIVQGRTQPDPDEIRLFYGTARTIETEPLTDWFETCNILYPRELLERVGGFDSDFAEAVEDTDLALRAIGAGARPVAAPEALVWHAVHVRPLTARLRETQRWTYNVLLFAKHPQHRAKIHRRLFWKVSHERLLALVLTLPLARRFPLLPLLAGAWYVRERIGLRSSLRRQIGAALQAPLVALVDGAEIVAHARGSIRHRTLVL